MQPIYFNRNISWLSFNERILHEADKSSLPLMERINFLSIYSSNFDEFFRVRMPALLALNNIKDSTVDTELVNQILELFTYIKINLERSYRTRLCLH